jgi:hypothetical protein
MTCKIFQIFCRLKISEEKRNYFCEIALTTYVCIFTILIITLLPVVSKNVIIHTHLENIVLIQKIISLKVAHPPQTRECKERESRYLSREGPRSSLPLHSQVKVVCHLKVNTFLMKDFIPSEFVCNFIYSF